jgi:glycosyltransferase 2 family protein
LKSENLPNAIRFAILVIFVFILWRMIDPSLLRDVLRSVRLDLIGLAILIYFGNIAIRAFRLRMLINQHRPLLSFQEAYLLTLIGIALNVIIPATMGDVARSYYGYRMYGVKEESLSTALVEKLLAFCSLFVLGVVSGYAMGHWELGTFSLVGATLTFLPLAIPRRLPWPIVNRLLRLIKKSLDQDKLIAAFTLSARLKLLGLLVSLLGWIGTSLFFYVVCAAFPVHVNLGYILLVMPILTIIRLFPFTINAIGPMEVAVAYFFGFLGIHSTLAVLISLTSNVLSSIVPGSLGLAIILLRGHSKRTV